MRTHRKQPTELQVTVTSRISDPPGSRGSKIAEQSCASSLVLESDMAFCLLDVAALAPQQIWLYTTPCSLVNALNKAIPRKILGQRTVKEARSRVALGSSNDGGRPVQLA